MYAFENAVFQLNVKKNPTAVEKYLRTINAATRLCLPHIAIYLACCQVCIRVSFIFTMALDSATELKDATSVISEKWNG